MCKNSEKQTEGFGREGIEGLGEPGGGYYGGHVLHGALGVVHNNESWNTEKNKKLKKVLLQEKRTCYLC